MYPWGNVGVVWGCWGSWCTPGGTYGDGLGVSRPRCASGGGYKGMAWGFDCPPHLVLVEGGTWRPPATLAAPPCPVGRMWAQFGGPICLYRTLGVGHGDNQGLPMTS